MSWVRLYARMIGASIRGQMQYKFNFIFSSMMAMFMFALEFLTVATVIYRFNGIHGWGVYEVGYLFTIMMFTRAFYRILAVEVNGFEKYLVHGLLDGLLVRPVPVLLVLMTRNFRPMLGELILGSVLVTICLRHLIGIGQVTWWAIPLTLVVVISGTVITFAIGLATATVGFWTHRIDDLQRITDNAATIAGQYPLSIYPRWMKVILLTVLPMGFTAYVPSLYIIRGELGAWVMAATILVAVLLLFAALRFWRYGIAHYQSTGT
jgi:ABC-2 type transport system permease protein